MIMMMMMITTATALLLLQRGVNRQECLLQSKYHKQFRAERMQPVQYNIHQGGRNNLSSSNLPNWTRSEHLQPPGAIVEPATSQEELSIRRWLCEMLAGWQVEYT